MLYKFVEALQRENVKESTIVNHLWALQRFLEYAKGFTSIKGRPHSSCLPHPYIVSKKLSPSIASISKGLRKERAVQKRREENFSEEVEGWPENGFKDLRKILKR